MDRIIGSAAIAVLCVLLSLAQSRGSEAANVTAVEYVGDHVFITANPVEIAALDSSEIPGWVRTGIEFPVSDAPEPGLVPVCRFYSEAFAPRSAHFHTAFAAECSALMANRAWIYEGVAFHARLPQPDGTCVAGSAPVHRWYNEGRGGAHNHRYRLHHDNVPTYDGYTDPLLLGHMRKGWVREGAGPDGTAFCVDAAGLRIGERAKVEASQQRLLAGSRWRFTAAGASFTLEFPPAPTDSEPVDVWPLAAEGRNGLAWSGEALIVELYGSGYIHNVGLALSFTGRDTLEGCRAIDDLEWGGPVGGGPYWVTCELVIGHRQ